MLYHQYRQVKNCITWSRSTRALCLVFNLVNKSFLILMWLTIGLDEVFFLSFYIRKLIFIIIIWMTWILKKKSVWKHFYIMMDVKGKTNDNMKTIMNIPLFFHYKNMELVYNWSMVVKPKASFVLDKNAQLLVYQWLKSLIFSDEYT
jgi:hypothetical protein